MPPLLELVIDLLPEPRKTLLHMHYEKFVMDGAFISIFTQDFDVNSHRTGLGA